MPATLIAADTTKDIEQGSTIYMGLGNVSCATWLLTSSETEKMGEQWIFGYFSGVNETYSFGGSNLLYGGDARDRGNVGHDTDQAGIAAEAVRMCKAEPSRMLRDVAGQVYLKLFRANR
jgi:hypothetical protein